MNETMIPDRIGEAPIDVDPADWLDGLIDVEFDEDAYEHIVPEPALVPAA
ncbi:hypothetical protein [Gordonia iterans]|nr:hypothetical protein [Gordonia iterans]